MAEPKQLDIKDCTFKLRDGTTPTPFTLAFKVDEGNVTWQERRNITAKKDRGQLDYLKEEDEENMTVSVEMRFTTMKASSGDPVTPYEFLHKTGGASAYLSVGSVCEADQVDIVVEVDRDCGTTVEDDIIVFPKFAFTEIGGDIRAGTFSVTGICNAISPITTKTTFA